MKMRLIVGLALLLTLYSCAEQSTEYAHIVDPASLLPAKDAQSLEAQLAGYEEQNLHFVAYLEPSLQGKDIETVVDETLKKTPVGEPGVQNGAMILIADAERQVKITCENGFEWQIPDSLSKEIYARMVPLLAEKQYAKALMQAFGEMAEKVQSLDWGVKYHSVEEVFAAQDKAIGGIAALTGVAQRTEYPADLLENQFSPQLRTAITTAEGDTLHLAFSKYMVETVEDGMISPRSWFFRITGTAPLQGQLLGAK